MFNDAGGDCVQTPRFSAGALGKGLAPPPPPLGGGRIPRAGRMGPPPPPLSLAAAGTFGQGGRGHPHPPWAAAARSAAQRETFFVFNSNL